MDWCQRAPSHYLNQCWPRYLYHRVLPDRKKLRRIFRKHFSIQGLNGYQVVMVIDISGQLWHTWYKPETVSTWHYTSIPETNLKYTLKYFSLISVNFAINNSIIEYIFIGILLPEADSIHVISYSSVEPISRSNGAWLSQSKSCLHSCRINGFRCYLPQCRLLHNPRMVAVGLSRVGYEMKWYSLVMGLVSQNKY